MLFDDNGEEIRDIQIFRTMDKLIEFVCRRDQRERHLFEGERMQTLYLGTKSFPREYDKLLSLKRSKFENELKRNKVQ